MAEIGNLRLVFGKPIVPPPVSEASEAAYEKLTAELKERVVGMWQELRREEGKSTEIWTEQLTLSKQMKEMPGSCRDFVSSDAKTRVY